MIIKRKQSSNIVPSEYVKNMEKLSKLAGFDHQNAIVFSVLIGEIKALEKKLDKQNSRFEKLERTVECIENYVEERTGLEPGKELTDSSDSEEEIIFPEETVSKKKRKYSGKKKVKQWPGKSWPAYEIHSR